MKKYVLVILVFLLSFSSFSQVKESDSNKKTLLAIGNSLTAYNVWPQKVGELLNMTVKSHAKSGLVLLQMVDGDNSDFLPLSIDDVTGVDYIALLGAYNNRHNPYGNLTDMYDESNYNTHNICAFYNYVIKRLRELLSQANNPECKIVLVTPHCGGKDPSINANGYQEWPVGSGRTMETLANMIVSISAHNNIPSIDLYHNCGIDSTNWSIYQSSSTPYNPRYVSANGKLGVNDPFNSINDLPKENVVENSYATIVDATSSIGYSIYRYVNREWNLVYTPRYPWNADQLHCSTLGYNKIGEYIASQFIEIFGNVFPPIDDTQPSNKIVKTEYYNLRGIKVNNVEKGVYIQKSIYEDNSQNVSKIIIK
jgi:hypothetical protein